MESAGIFGPKLSGKTTLAKEISRECWLAFKLRTLVLDPHLENWGPQAWMTKNEDLFWETVWKTRNCLVIVEESAATIRRDRNLTPVFTRLRHNKHKLLVIGHDGTDLLPVMRRQFDTLFLFRQSEAAAKIWCNDFTEPRLVNCSKLKQYEFIFARLYHDPVVRKLQKPKLIINEPDTAKEIEA